MKITNDMVEKYHFITARKSTKQRKKTMPLSINRCRFAHVTHSDKRNIVVVRREWRYNNNITTANIAKDGWRL